MQIHTSWRTHMWPTHPLCLRWLYGATTVWVFCAQTLNMSHKHCGRKWHWKRFRWQISVVPLLNCCPSIKGGLTCSHTAGILGFEDTYPKTWGDESGFKKLQTALYFQNDPVLSFWIFRCPFLSLLYIRVTFILSPFVGSRLNESYSQNRICTFYLRT